MTAVLDFLAPLFSLLGIASVGTIAAAVAVALYLPGFRQLAITAGVGAGLLFAGIAYGDRNGADRVQARWDAVDARAVKDRERRDRDIADRTRAESQRSINELLNLAADSERKALDYETQLRSRPACMLDADDVGRMPAVR